MSIEINNIEIIHSALIAMNLQMNHNYHTTRIIIIIIASFMIRITDFLITFVIFRVQVLSSIKDNEHFRDGMCSLCVFL